ncbi:ABC transporter permease [Kitasatospora sp. MAP5-34]|uniref:ABC transporter permease n=1 Tax=Kitasatospora sp. MAP5-34 TaxID=3035102 RepID=UPI00247683A7|nr:ABC transporter permease [Kitasatospora sp. MAP5-34]MDH6579001.1 ABC-2 type transport system permease protein [Kitasatospora sp. MAP5-34]
MTTLTAPARNAEPRPRFFDLCAAEWIKVRSLRSTSWVLTLSVLGVIAINVNAVHSDFPYIDGPHPRMPGWPPYHYDALFHGLGMIPADLFMITTGSIGAITLFGEYASGMIRTTFAAVPDRRSVVAAKVTVVTALMLVAGTIASTGSFFLTNAMLASRHVGLSISDPGCLGAVAAYALIAPVSALVGIGLGAAIRHATATIVALVGTLLLVPLLFQGDRFRWVKEIGNALPKSALERLTYNPDSNSVLGKYPPSITESWIVFGGWSLVAVIVAIAVVNRRDV